MNNIRLSPMFKSACTHAHFDTLDIARQYDKLGKRVVESIDSLKKITASPDCPKALKEEVNQLIAAMEGFSIPSVDIFLSVAEQLQLLARSQPDGFQNHLKTAL